MCGIIYIIHLSLMGAEGAWSFDLFFDPIFLSGVIKFAHIVQLQSV